MLPLLYAMHVHGSKRGDGLRNEFFRHIGGMARSNLHLQADRTLIVCWKPISKLTDADLEMGWMHHRLVMWNSCNGPHHYRYVPAEDADDIKREGVWEKFLILPEAA